MATTFQDSITFAGDVTVSGTFTAAGVPSLNGSTLLVNGDAAAGTDQDPALALLGGDGGSELIRTTLGQDSSADKAFLKMQGGSSGTTEKSMTLHVGTIGTTAAVNSTLVLEAGASSTNKPASLVNTGSTGILAVTATTGVTLSDSVGTLSLNAGALTESSLASADITPSGALNLRGGGASSFGDDTGYIGFDGAGAVSTTGVTTLALTASSTAQISGTAVSLNGSTAVSAIIPDNTANAFRVLEGANEYLKVTTTNSGEAIALGNATTNPALNVLGTGTATFGGNIAMGGNKVTGLAAATGNGEAVRYEQVVLSASRAVLWYVGAGARASSNTNVMRFPTLDSSRSTGSGITRSDASTTGTYFEVDTAGIYQVSCTYCPTGGTADVAIKAAAAVNNSFAGTDTDIVAAAFAGAANHPVHIGNTLYVPANTRFWVVATRDGDGQAYHNMLNVCGPL